MVSHYGVTSKWNSIKIDVSSRCQSKVHKWEENWLKLWAHAQSSHASTLMRDFRFSPFCVNTFAFTIRLARTGNHDEIAATKLFKHFLRRITVCVRIATSFPLSVSFRRRAKLFARAHSRQIIVNSHQISTLFTIFFTQSIVSSRFYNEIHTKQLKFSSFILSSVFWLRLLSLSASSMHGTLSVVTTRAFQVVCFRHHTRRTAHTHIRTHKID